MVDLYWLDRRRVPSETAHHVTGPRTGIADHNEQHPNDHFMIYHC